MCEKKVYITLKPLASHCLQTFLKTEFAKNKPFEKEWKENSLRVYTNFLDTDDFFFFFTYGIFSPIFS